MVSQGMLACWLCCRFSNVVAAMMVQNNIEALSIRASVTIIKIQISRKTRLCRAHFIERIDSKGYQFHFAAESMHSHTIVVIPSSIASINLKIQLYTIRDTIILQCQLILERSLPLPLQQNFMRLSSNPRCYHRLEHLDWI